MPAPKGLDGRVFYSRHSSRRGSANPKSCVQHTDGEEDPLLPTRPATDLRTKASRLVLRGIS